MFRRPRALGEYDRAQLHALVTGESESAQTIPRRSSDRPARLSFPQERQFLLDQIMPGLGAYNVPTLVKVRTTLDAEKLGEAFQRVVERHQILRTRIKLEDGELVQEIFDPPAFDLTIADLRSMPEEQ